MDKKKIRLLVIDDSVLYRSQIQLALKDVPEIEIVGSAHNGQHAIEKMKEQYIDVCTLDVEMPVMDGISTLKEMKKLGIKTKAIMFSSLTQTGAEKTLEALSEGAVDFVTKPQVDISKLSPSEKIRELILPKIFALFGMDEKYVPKNDNPKRIQEKTFWDMFYPDVLVIASSTGGPNALVEYFTQLKEPVPYPILITQHMPPLFTASLAERLGVYSGKISREAINGEILKPNQIYVAPGNFHMSLIGDRRNPQIELSKGDLRNYVRPCADYLFESASKIYGRNTLGIVFTGMGRDGLDGALAIKEKKGAIMIQNEESCIVFGMPGAIFEEGCFDFSGDPIQLAQKTLLISRLRRGQNVA